jgi:hypothetical protein
MRHHPRATVLVCLFALILIMMENETRSDESAVNGLHGRGDLRHTMMRS